MGTLMVTGGAGFIGSHFCKILSDAGREFIVYDNLHRGNREAVRFSEIVVGDIRDSERLRQTIEQYNITSVAHFAALAYVRESLEFPLRYWSNNVEGTASLLNAIQDSSVRSLIFSSSCAIYGTPGHMPITLESGQHPINPYGRTKLVCEWRIQDMMQKNGLPYVLLRYFNVAGSDPEQEIGEVHSPETHIIPILLLKALEDAPRPVQIFGDQHPTPDGTCVRDYVHVMDLARVHLRALDYLENGGASRAFNVGLGRGTSIAELIEICRRVTGREIPCRYEESNPGDPPILVADPGDTWSQLQLEPQYPNVEDMVRHSWDWMRDKRDLWLDRNKALNPVN